MIIECINCYKKFSVNSELIPSKGRTIQCGSCNHVWFFDKNYETSEEVIVPKIEENIEKIDEILKDDKKENVNKVQKNKLKSNFTLGRFLSYILVIIISFIGLIILLDTFKLALYKVVPSLEVLLFNLFETLKDIKLFIKDLF